MFNSRNSFHRAKTVRWLSMACILILSAAFVGVASAQTGSALTDGSIVTGAISDQAHTVTYTYDGFPQDLITVEVLAASAGMSPTVSLLSPEQQELTNSQSSIFRAGGSAADAMLSFRLRERGTYTISVGGSNGNFVLRFNAHRQDVIPSIQMDTSTSVNIAPGSTAQTFSFTANADSPTSLFLSGQGSGFGFSGQLYDPNGLLIGVLGGTSLQSACLTVLPGSDVYQLWLSGLNSQLSGVITVSLSKGAACGAAAAPTSAAPTNVPFRPTATRTATAAATATATLLSTATITNTAAGAPTATPTRRIIIVTRVFPTPTPTRRIIIITRRPPGTIQP